MLVGWIFCVLVYSGEGAGGAWEPKVTLPQGTLAGVLVYDEGGGGAAATGRGLRAVRAFLAVPYAAPPIAGLRLQPPQRHPGWNGTLRAQRPAPPCVHLDVEPSTSSEDCLYLDVWTPEGANGNLPVLVWLWGSSEPAPPCQELASGGAVVVTVRFRRGPLALGALGILDQYMALAWLRSNVPTFGGDSNALTLLGRGSAADDVLHHLISPRTDGLVSHFAAMSPTLLGLRGRGEKQLLQSAQESRAAELLGCGRPQSAFDSFDPAHLAACYRHRGLPEIIAAYKLAFKEPWWEWPVVDSWLPKEEQYSPLSMDQWLLISDTRSPSSVGLMMGRLADASLAVATSNIEDVQLPLSGSHAVGQTARLSRGNGSLGIDLISDVIRWEYGAAGDEQSADADALFWGLCEAFASRIEYLYVYHLRTEGSEVNEEALIAGGATLRQAERKYSAKRRLPRRHPPLREHLLHYISTGSPLSWWRPWTLSSPQVCTLDGEDAPHEGEQKIGSEPALRSALFWTRYLPRLRNFLDTGTDGYSSSSSIRSDELGARSAELSVRVGLIGGICALLGLLLLMVLLLKRSGGAGAVAGRQRHDEHYGGVRLDDAGAPPTGWRRFMPDLPHSHQANSFNLI